MKSIIVILCVIFASCNHLSFNFLENPTEPIAQTNEVKYRIEQCMENPDFEYLNFSFDKVPVVGEPNIVKVVGIAKRTINVEKEYRGTMGIGTNFYVEYVSSNINEILKAGDVFEYKTFVIFYSTSLIGWRHEFVLVGTDKKELSCGAIVVDKTEE
jgi:hypothetical protein